MKRTFFRQCCAKHTIISIVYVACGLTVWHVSRSIPVVLAPDSVSSSSDCTVSSIQTDLNNLHIGGTVQEISNGSSSKQYSGINPSRIVRRHLTTSHPLRSAHPAIEERRNLVEIKSPSYLRRPQSFSNDELQYSSAENISYTQHHRNPVQSIEDLIPKTVHITWFFPHGTEFRFHHAICLLSVQRFFRPTKIFFWHDALPTGRWWAFVRQSVAHLLLVPYSRPTSVFSRNVTVPEHQSDVARLELIEEYGGLYVDLDVILVRPLDPLLRYDTTLGAETPNMLGSGLILARPNSTFVRLWRQSYADEFDDSDWNHQSVIVPMRLARRHPRLVHVEWFSINRPNWYERDWLFTAGKLWNWSDNYAVHLWYREHNVDYDPLTIRTLNTTLGEVLRHIYYDHPGTLTELIADR